MRDGFRVVDADRHVMEPSDLWDRYLPAAYRGRVRITGPTQAGRYVDGRQVSDLATAMGVQVGNPSRKVVSINGDGGFFYNVQELSTIAQQKLPVVAIVFNDNAYGNVRRSQGKRFEGRYIASDLYNPDLMKLADAYGIAGRRAKNPAELRRELRSALSAAEPTLIVGPMPSMGGQGRASRI